MICWGDRTGYEGDETPSIVALYVPVGVPPPPAIMAVTGAAWAAMSGAEGADIWKAGMMAAAMVAVSYGIGKLFGDVQALINDGAINGMEVARAAAHGISGGIAEQINGGDFGAGFASSFVGSAAGSAMQSGAMGRFFEGKDASAVFKRTTAAAIIGGTTAEIGGGKFANGAMTAAIQHLFNHEGGALDEETADSWTAMSEEESAVELRRIENEGLSTIIADGNGGIIPYVSMKPETEGGLSTTAIDLIKQGKIIHETGHINDALRAAPDIAKGLKYGQIIRPTNISTFNRTELRAYTSEFQYLKGLLYSKDGASYSSSLSDLDVRTMNGRLIKVGAMGQMYWDRIHKKKEVK